MEAPIKTEQRQEQDFRSCLYSATLAVLEHLEPLNQKEQLIEAYKATIRAHKELFDEELVRWTDMEKATLHRLDCTGAFCCAAIGSAVDSIKQARILAENVSAVFHNHPLPRHFCLSTVDTLILLRAGVSLSDIQNVLEGEYALDFRTDSKDPVQSAFQVLLSTDNQAQACEEADLLEEGEAFLANAMINAYYGTSTQVDLEEVHEVLLRVPGLESRHVEQGLHRFYLQMKNQTAVDAMLDGLVDCLAQGLQVYLPIEACSEDEPNSFLVPDGRRMKLKRVKGPHEEKIQPVFTSMKEVRKSPCTEVMRKSFESVLQEFKTRTDVNRIGLNLFDEGLSMDQDLVDILLEAWWKTVDRENKNA